MMAAAARGLGLVGLAVIVGVILLQATDDASPPSAPDVVVAGDDTTTTTTTTLDVVDPGTGLRPPNQVQVLVLNGARIAGAAGDISEELGSIGYQMLEPGNAPTQDETVIHFKPGFEGEASALVPEVSDNALVEPLQDPPQFAGTENADVVVVLGREIGGSGGSDADDTSGDDTGSGDTGTGDADSG